MADSFAVLKLNEFAELGVEIIEDSGDQRSLSFLDVVLEALACLGDCGLFLKEEKQDFEFERGEKSCWFFLVCVDFGISKVKGFYFRCVAIGFKGLRFVFTRRRLVGLIFNLMTFLQ